jgi:dTDP-4-dehydrorhamnose reductase
LVDWIISKKNQTIEGYRDYMFSGLSMTSLARAIIEVIDKDSDMAGLYHLSGPKISKLELLEMLSETLKLDVKVRAVNGQVIDRSLDATRFYSDTGLDIPTLESMMLEVEEEARFLGML